MRSGSTSKGLLHHTYSFLGVETYKQVSTQADPDRRRHVEDAVRGRRAQAGDRGQVTLWANDEQIGEGTIAQDGAASPSRATPAWTSDATTACVVDLAYEDKAPYVFTGTVKKVVFDLKPVASDDHQALHEAAHQAGVAHAISA